MGHGNEPHGLTRRRMLRAAGVAGVAGLAGCGTNTDAEQTTAGEGEGEATTAGTATSAGGDAATSSAEPTVGGDFTVASLSTPSSINPMRTDDTTTAARVSRMFDAGGAAYDRETFLPRWFESWELSDSSDVVEYTLREGLEWGGDYGELTAEDYIYNLNELILLTGDEDWYGFTDTQFYQIGPDAEFVRFEKTGTYSLRAELPVTKATWLHEDPLPSQFVLPKELIEEYRADGDAEGLDRDPAITDGVLSRGNLGAWQFERWNRNSQMVFTRNDDYYLADVGEVRDLDYTDSPFFESYTYQQFDESSTSLSALEAGEVDVAGITDRKVANFRGRDDITLWESPFDNGVFWLNLNHRINGWAPIRESRQVRYAIGNVFDPDTIIEEAYAGLAVPLRTFHPSWGPYYPDESELTSLPGDLELARQQLEEGTSSDYGYDGGEFLGPDGEQVELSIVRSTGNPSVEISANFLQQRLAEAGIESTVEAKQWSTLLSNYAQNSADNVEGVDEPDYSVGSFNGGPWDQAASAEQWDLMLGLGFSTAPFAPWSAIRSTLAERGTFNMWGYTQDEYDIQEFIGRASTTDDLERLRADMTELFAFISRDMPFIFTSSGYNVSGYRSNVRGFPGEATEDGYEATDYFQTTYRADPSRLYSFEDA